MPRPRCAAGRATSPAPERRQTCLDGPSRRARVTHPSHPKLRPRHPVVIRLRSESSRPGRRRLPGTACCLLKCRRRDWLGQLDLSLSPSLSLPPSLPLPLSLSRSLSLSLSLSDCAWSALSSRPVRSARDEGRRGDFPGRPQSGPVPAQTRRRGSGAGGYGAGGVESCRWEGGACSIVSQTNPAGSLV